MVLTTLNRYGERPRKVQGDPAHHLARNLGPLLICAGPRTWRPRSIRSPKPAAGAQLFGSPAYEMTPQGEYCYNRAYLLNPQAETVGPYDKAHLVPYGEYAPLCAFSPFTANTGAHGGRLCRRAGGATVSLPEGAIGPSCY